MGNPNHPVSHTKAGASQRAELSRPELTLLCSTCVAEQEDLPRRWPVDDATTRDFANKRNRPRLLSALAWYFASTLEAEGRLGLFSGARDGMLRGTDGDGGVVGEMGWLSFAVGWWPGAGSTNADQWRRAVGWAAAKGRREKSEMAAANS